MHATDGQTKSSLIAPSLRSGHNNEETLTNFITDQMVADEVTASNPIVCLYV